MRRYCIYVLAKHWNVDSLFFFSKVPTVGQNKKQPREAEEAFFNEYLISRTTILTTCDQKKKKKNVKKKDCD